MRICGGGGGVKKLGRVGGLPRATLERWLPDTCTGGGGRIPGRGRGLNPHQTTGQVQGAAARAPHDYPFQYGAPDAGPPPCWS